jgi:hypothetical protein
MHSVKLAVLGDHHNPMTRVGDARGEGLSAEIT